MSFLKSLLNKKKTEETDGQEEYFKEDFAPVVKKPTANKAEAKTDEAKKVAAKTEKAEPKKAPAKTTAKAEPKKAVKVEKSEPKKAEKAVAKAEPKKAVAKTEAKKPAVKAAAKPEPKKAVTKAEPKKAENAEPKKASAKATKSNELSDNSPEVKGAVSVEESKATANGKWDIRRAKDGRFFFSLYASNHTVIAYSQIYSSTSAVTTGINSVIANAPKAEIEDTTLKKAVSLPCPKWEIYFDKAGEYRFRLYAPNGLVVCHSSHGYSTKSGCKGGIESITRFCAEARVDKSYLNKE